MINIPIWDFLIWVLIGCVCGYAAISGWEWSARRRLRKKVQEYLKGEDPKWPIAR